ncbi:MAG: hypothetical protein ACKVI4_16350 [Actinomycetales bacterium]
MIYAVDSPRYARYVDVLKALPPPPPPELELEDLVERAVHQFRQRVNRSHASMLVVHRVSKLPGSVAEERALLATIDNPEGLTLPELLVRQAEYAGEVAGFARHNGTKLLLWSRYVPPDGKQVLANQRISPDLAIDADVGMSRDAFLDWYWSCNMCAIATCGVKLVLDMALAHGERVRVRRHVVPGLDVDCHVQFCTRVTTQPQLPINAFQVVDPTVQPEWAYRQNEIAFPVFHQGTQAGHTTLCLHQLLEITARSVSGEGEERRFYLDPSYRQVTPFFNAPHKAAVRAIGATLPAAYGEELERHGDDPCFDPKLLRWIVVNCCVPDSEQYADEQYADCCDKVHDALLVGSGVVLGKAKTSKGWVFERV